MYFTIVSLELERKLGDEKRTPSRLKVRSLSKKKNSNR
jgi:hypothetical protein